MKIRDYTYQTGHCLTHETSANRMHPEVRKIITRLIAAGKGSLPGFGGCTYQFVSESDDLASLSVEHNGAPIWFCFFCPYRDSTTQARRMLDETAERLTLEGLPMHGRLPDLLETPCILTMLLPSAAGAPFELIQVLGGMPRDFATVWFTQQFGDLS